MRWVLVLSAAAPLCVVALAAQTSLRQRIVAAEDARVATAAGIAPILEGLRSADATLVAMSARALGRFERPEFTVHLLPLLAHEREQVRQEAANALGQSSEVGQVARVLLERLDTEADPYVRGTIAETLGRLRYRDDAGIRAADTALRAQLQTLHPGTLTGAVKGLESLIRINRQRYTAHPMTIERLRSIAVSTLYRLDDGYIAIRRLAWLAVNASASADLSLVEQGYADSDWQVRRLAVVALLNLAGPVDARRPALLRGMADPSFNVRYEAVRIYGQRLRDTDCAPLIAATRDPGTHVVLAAIDALGGGCPTGPDPAAVLAGFADRLAGDGAPWHAAAHALVALARVSPDEARRRLPRFAGHAVWQVRAYAARAAAVLAEPMLLERLATTDQHDNVRYEAVEGLRRVRGHAADRIYVDSLARPDSQLVLTAADALEGSTSRDAAVPVLLEAFARITRERRETSRDPRVAILKRLRELGAREHAAGLHTCLRDVDPVVADECAATIEAWTGTRPPTRPEPLRREPPDDRLPSRARVTMADGRVFELGLWVDDAPASVSRFAGLVRRRYYDGLTFHRVLPNFVVQGGSPGANEYAGDGPFMRDELGLRSNARGTVGVSTRGRDTGDAQWFINLVDNPRFDHEYTVFAEVTAGMDVVDDLLEGGVIARIELR